MSESRNTCESKKINCVLMPLSLRTLCAKLSNSMGFAKSIRNCCRKKSLRQLEIGGIVPIEIGFASVYTLCYPLLMRSRLLVIHLFSMSALAICHQLGSRSNFDGHGNKRAPNNVCRAEICRTWQFDPVALGVRFTFDLHLEVDGAHYAIAKLLLDECFPSCS
jgi:hypothetical protein